jgi:hypothetical protein
VSRAIIRDVVQAILDGHDVVIAGVSGVGKSYVATQAAQRLVDKGFLVHQISGSPAGDALPLAPLARIVGGSVDGGLVHTALKSLCGDDANQPALLIVDDAEALDEASASWSINWECRAEFGLC